MRQMRIIFKIFLTASIICFLVGAGVFVNRILFLNKAVCTDGIVINLKKQAIKDSDGEPAVLYTPEVQFKTKDGELKTFVSSISSTRPAFVGSKVNVLYENSSGYAEIDSFMTKWFVVLVLFFIGIVFGIISIGGLLRLRSGKAMGVSYSTELNGKEIIYYFKRNKTCPVCNGKLIKEKKKIDKGVGLSEWNGIDGGSYTYGQRYDVKYWYKCSECGESFPIEKLVSP